MGEQRVVVSSLRSVGFDASLPSSNQSVLPVLFCLIFVFPYEITPCAIRVPYGNFSRTGYTEFLVAGTDDDIFLAK